MVPSEEGDNVTDVYIGGSVIKVDTNTMQTILTNEGVNLYTVTDKNGDETPPAPLEDVSDDDVRDLSNL